MDKALDGWKDKLIKSHQPYDCCLVSQVLLDEVVDLRNMARDILSRFFHIDNQTALFPRLQLDTG